MIKRPNLNSDVLHELSGIIGLRFVPDGWGNETLTYGPDSFFGYIYATLHSPSYRARYQAFLKTDFPRVPKPGSRRFFWELAHLGRDLVEWHTLDEAKTAGVSLADLGAAVEIGRAYPQWREGRVYLNAEVCLEGVSEEVWNHRIGGYQVARRWLRDRRGRALDKVEIAHYQWTLAALEQTRELMAAIDRVVTEAGGWDRCRFRGEATK